MNNANALQLTPQPKSSKASRGSTLAQARGSHAEDAVERLHNNDFFRRLNPGVSLMRRHAKSILVHGMMRQIKPQGPDFGGGAPASTFRFESVLGVWVEVEVKFVDAINTPRLDLSRFTDAEVEKLTDCRRAGGVAIVLVLMGATIEVATWCAIPWGALHDAVKAYRDTLDGDGKKRKLTAAQKLKSTPVDASISREWLQQYATPPMQYLQSSKVGPGR